MKKFLLYGMMVAAMAGTVNAQTIDWSTSAEQTVKSFVSVPKTDEVQLITNQAGFLVDGIDFKLDKFVVECLTTAQDLQNGQDGALPKFAEVNKLSLKGANLSENRNMSIAAYVENTNEAAIRNLDANAVDATLPNDEFKVANMTQITMPEAEVEGYVVALPFDIKPFYYQGDAAYITLDMQTPDDVIFNFNVTTAATQVPVVYRNNFLPFYAGMSNESDKVPTVYKQAFKDIVEELNIQANTLPAYELEYYTHDINGTVKNEDGSPYAGAEIIVTVGNEEYQATSAADGTFVIEGLDYTQPCTINVTTGNDTATAQMSFGSNENDIIVNVVASPVTAVDNINAGKTVASISYYDLAGRASNEPVNGVNVKVTRYSDGTTSIVKMVR